MLIEVISRQMSDFNNKKINKPYNYQILYIPPQEIQAVSPPKLNQSVLPQERSQKLTPT